MRVPVQDKGGQKGGPFTGPVGTAASQIFNVAQSFVFESAFKFSNIQCFMVKVENGGKWMNHLFLPQVLEALQAIRKTNNQPHLNLVN